MTSPILPRMSIGMTLGLVLSACTFGPKGTPPETPQPNHYGVTAQPARTVTAAGVSQAFVVGAKPVPDWWKAYRSDALNALVDEGLRNSLTLASADKTLAAAKEQYRAQVGSSMLPTIDAGGQANRERSLTLPGLGPPTALYDIFAGQFQLQYTFDFFGASRLADRALAAQVDNQSWQLDAARRALAANIVTGAIGAASLHAQIDTTERLIALSDQDARETQRRFELGSASHIDVDNARANTASLASSLPGMRQQWLATRHALAVLLGRTPDQAPPDIDLATLTVPANLPVVVPSDLLASRPDIQAADALLKAAAAQVGVATAQLFPSLTLSASMGKAGFDWPTALSGAGAIWHVGASITQPIFHGGALLAQRRAAQDSYDAAVLQYKQTVLSAFRNVADSLAAIEQDNEALAHADTARQASLDAFNEAASRVAMGAIPASSGRAGERQYQNARLTAIQYESARLSDTALLFQAMGR